MAQGKLAVLLVSDHPADAALVRTALTAVGTDPARVLTWVPTVGEAYVELGARDFDCVLLDVDHGLDTLAAVLGHDRSVPVIALVGPGEPDLGLEALRHGAQDHLPKADLDGRLLLRSVDYARDRQRTRAELRRTEHLYRSVVDALTEGVLVFSASGRIQTANASALEVLGIPLDEVTGMAVGDPRWNVVTAGGQPFPAEELPVRVALRTGEVVRGTVLGLTRADGEFAWLEVNATPLAHEAGEAPYGVVLSVRDITLRQAAEHAVRDVERRQRLVLQNASEGYVITDAAGRIVTTSASREGTRPWDTAPGTDVGMLLHPDDVGGWRAVLAAVLADPWTPRTAEVRVSACAAGYVWTELTVTNWLMDPSVGGIVLNHRSIEERRESEEALRFQGELLHAVREAVIATDMSGRVVYWNPAAEQTYGWCPDDAIGRELAELIPGWTLDAEAMSTLLDGGTWSTDFVIRRAGADCRILVSLTPLLGDGDEVVGIIGVGTDITQRQRAEHAMHELSAIVESSDAAIVGKDADGVISSWNRAATELYGYTAEEIVGRHISALAPPDRTDEVETLLARMRAGHRIEHVETVRRHKDGTLLDVSLIISPIVDREGRRIGSSSITRDITERKRRDAEAQRDRRRLAEAQRLAQLGSFEVDVDTGASRWSAELFRILGIDAAVEPSLERLFGSIHPDDLLAVNRHVKGVMDRGETADGVCRILRADGMRWVHIRARAVPGENGDKVTGTVIDVTERRRSERERQVAEEQLRLGFENAAVGILMVDSDCRVTMANPAMQALLGRADTELLGHRIDDFLHPDDREPALGRFATLAKGDLDSYQAERRYLRPDGQVVWALANVSPLRRADGHPEYFFAQVQDITDRKAMEDALEHLAVHDALTQLPNRTLLTDRVEHALGRTGRHGGDLAVLFVDLDRFKVINDGMGHRAGDELLTMVADRLREAVRPSDTVGRFGGDEFVVVCEQLDGPWEATRIGDRIARALGQPMVIEGREVVVTASVGIAIAGPDTTADSLLRDADVAMYRAKERGRARVEVFDEALRGRAAERLELEGALRRALATGELRLAYQPIVRVSDEEIVAAETLLRWPHPTRGMISPAEFIPLAEETGLIVPIGAWALSEALQQLRRWHDEGRELALGVNLSARQLTAPDLVETVRSALRESGVRPELVHLEITESVVMDDVEQSIETMTALRALGIRFAVDDFGTGYSSLSYLKRLPIDTLKIDQSFVRGLGVDENDSSIVRAIVGMGRALGLSLLAEGVEDPRQLAELRAMGCDIAQGFRWSPAVPAAEFPTSVRR